ncbi:MAG TPA: pirin family protein [Burkholderiales bacterium]
MNWHSEPNEAAAGARGAVDAVIVPRARDLGGFEVRRALPAAGRQMVGPFIFLDQMGPATFEAGRGVDVRPHPHINLATVTYLFAGEILHRDSLGNVQPIRPGEVNWMTAGRGITHSERTAPETRARGHELFGLQTWVALPAEAEETEPAFAHYAASALPLLEDSDKTVRLIAGTLYGHRSPVRTFGGIFYAHALLAAGAKLPLDTEHEERAVYVLSGEIAIGDQDYAGGRLLVLRPGEPLTLRARSAASLMLLGGATMDGPRYIWWNFVSSRRERIEQAAADWEAGKFPPVAGDDKECIPLPSHPGVALYP